VRGASRRFERLGLGVISCGWYGKNDYREMLAAATLLHPEPPPELNWEMRTGTAPLRPYHDGIHLGAWRRYREYCNGMVGNMCIGRSDTMHRFLGVGWPERIAASGGIFSDRNTHANLPDTQTALYEDKNLTITCQHRTWGAATDPVYPCGLVLYGSGARSRPVSSAASSSPPTKTRSAEKRMSL
jgi:hypothetical protein